MRNFFLSIKDTNALKKYDIKILYTSEKSNYLRVEINPYFSSIKKVLNINKNEKLSIIDFLYGIGCTWVFEYQDNLQYQPPEDLADQIKDKEDFNKALNVSKQQVAIATKQKSSNQCALQGDVVILKNRIKVLNNLIDKNKNNKSTEQIDTVDKFLTDIDDWVNNLSQNALNNFNKIHSNLRFLNLLPLDNGFAYKGYFIYQNIRFSVYLRLSDDFLDKRSCDRTTTFYLEITHEEALLSIGHPVVQDKSRITLDTYLQIANFIKTTSKNKQANRLLKAV